MATSSAHPTPLHHARTPHVAATRAAKVRVVVTDVVGLQRVLTLLTGRQHAFSRLEAEEAGDDRWTVSFDLVDSPTRADLVAARLHRLPSVLTVEITSPQLATTG